MRRRSLLVRLIVPALLVVLVGVLALLQYRWLTQVSDAERDRRQAWLRQHAEQFANDFDSEISRLYVTLQNQTGSLLANEPESFARSYDTWHERARFPQMLRALYYVDASGQPAIRQFHPDQRVFVDASWPAELVPIREAMTQTPPPTRPEGARGGVMYLQPPIAADIPALVVGLPNMHTMPGTEPRTLITVGLGQAYLIAELDRSVITATILPALMAQHFPDDRATDAYRVAILDRTRGNAVLASKNIAEGASIDQAHADASVPLFSLRLDLLTQVVARTERTTPGAGVVSPARPRLTTPISPGTAETITGTVTTGVVRPQIQFYVESRGTKTDVLKTTSFGPAAWQLVLQHSAGSLDAAVTQVRRRNLWVSFGILAVLASGIGLVVVNSQRAQRLAGQQMDFVATVSHELRTPLAVIRSAAQNLSAGVVHDTEQAKKYGDLIEDEGRRLTRTVDQVLEYAGLTAANRTAWPPADVGAVVRELASAQQPKFQAAGVDVHVDIARDLPPVAIDADALHRALDNLLANAIKYGADGRWLQITAAPAIVHRRAEVQVSVSDRGRGIDAADLPHIFEPFYRGRHAIDRQIDGSGLGLSLVKRIAEMRGGDVTVESSRGQGATFTLHLPVVHDVPANVTADLTIART